ncbi:MAG: hypothetical protein AAF702_12190 [Chloroflexota bacterium]
MTIFSAPGLLFILAIWLLLLGWLHRRSSQHKPTLIDVADLFAGGLLFLITIAFFWRTLIGDVFQPADGGDLVSFLFPTYRFSATQISQWSLPIWNPHLYGGAPFISDIQAGFLYLPNLFLFLLDPFFDYRVMQILSQLHLFWAGLGMYVLLRSLRWQEWTPSRPASILAAIAFQFSDPFLIHLGNLNLIAVLSWLPWILAAFHRAFTQQSFRWGGIGALLFSIANYAGHAQSSIYLAFALGTYWLVATWSMTSEPLSSESTNQVVDDSDRSVDNRSISISHIINRHLATLPYLLVTVVLTLLLTAPILLPAIEMSTFTERADLTYQETTQFSLAPTQAVGLITPSFFGRGPALHWGLWDRVETPYAGIITLMLAILGLTLANPRQRRLLWPWIGIAVFGFATALGVYSILHGWLTLLVPSFDQFRAPARSLVLWTLGVSIMAAFGLDRIRALGHQLISSPGNQTTVNHASMQHRILGTGSKFLAGVTLPLSYLSLLLTQHNESMFLRASVAAIALTVAAFFWLIGWAMISTYQARWMNSSTFGWLMVGILFAELSANGGAYLDVSERDPTTGYHHPEIVAFLQGEAQAPNDLFRIDTRTDIQSIWQPNAAIYHNLQDVWGVANPLVLESWKRMWNATGGRHTRVYDMLNVKYVLVPDGVPLPDGKFEIAFDTPGPLSVHKNLGFMPRAWVVHSAQFVADEDAAFAALGREDFDPNRTLILIADQGETNSQDNSPDQKATATILHYGSSEMTLQVQTASPGYLVLSEVWYPGWRATVNDASQPVLQANGAQRAVRIPTGNSTIRLWFSPNSWRLGLSGFVIGLLLLVLCLLNIKKP